MVFQYIHVQYLQIYYFFFFGYSVRFRGKTNLCFFSQNFVKSPEFFSQVEWVAVEVVEGSFPK